MMLITVSSYTMVKAPGFLAWVTVGFMVFSFPEAHSWIFDLAKVWINRQS
jgi:hypothetical protein